MAPPNLNTVSNDVLLEIIDWLEAITARETKYYAPREVDATGKDVERSMRNLASVNKHFHALLVSHVYRNFAMTKRYNFEHMSKFLDVLEASPTAQSCIRRLTFTPMAYDQHHWSAEQRHADPTQKQQGTKFVDHKRLLTAFRSLMSLQDLTLFMPLGSISGYKPMLLKSSPVLFPNVTSLTIPTSASYVLKQCPRVERLALLFHMRTCAGSKHEKNMAPDLWENIFVNYLYARIITLSKVIAERPVGCSEIRSLSFGLGIWTLHNDIVKELATCLPKIQNVIIDYPDVFSVLKWAQFLSGFPAIRSLHLPRFDQKRAMIIYDRSPGTVFLSRADRARSYHEHAEKVVSDFAKSCTHLTTVTFPSSGCPHGTDRAEVKIERDSHQKVLNLQWNSRIPINEMYPEGTDDEDPHVLSDTSC